MQRSHNSPNVAAVSIAVLLIAAAVGAAPAADPSEVVPVAGPVVAFTAGSGSGMPMLSVDDAALGTVDVALGPVWFLQETEFSAAVGDQVNLEAFACAACAAPLVAAWVDNITTGASIDLRNDDGVPLWIQRQAARGGSGRPGQGNGGQGGGGQGNGGQGGGGQGGGSGSGGGSGQPGGVGTGSGSGPANGSGLDMSQVATVTGTVLEFIGHAGAGQPVLHLETDAGVIEIVVSPYHPVAAAGLEIAPGMDLTVTFAPTDCDDNPQNIAIAILDPATGLQIQLRDPETGFPMTNGGGHNRPNWP